MASASGCGSNESAHSRSLGGVFTARILKVRLYMMTQTKRLALKPRLICQHVKFKRGYSAYKISIKYFILNAVLKVRVHAFAMCTPNSSMKLGLNTQISTTAEDIFYSHCGYLDFLEK